MAEKHTDEKLYRVVRKDGSHLNTKVNPDGTKSALQFPNDNNDLNGSARTYGDWNDRFSNRHRDGGNLVTGTD